jgi:hypothetical protein
MKKILAFVILFIFMVSCGTPPMLTRNTANTYPIRTEPAKIQVFYSEPTRKYLSLGIINWNYYQPGVTTPSITTIIPELQKEASKIGGDAIVIRQQSVTVTDRNLIVAVEILRWTD